MTTPTTPALPTLPFAVFDEFGRPADDRVQDYGRQCAEARDAMWAAQVKALRVDAERYRFSVVPELLEALVWREQFEPRDGEDSTARFDRIADVFYRETGHLRPGKDCRLESPEVRQAAWDEWMEAGRVRVRAAILAARTTKGA